MRLTDSCSMSVSTKPGTDRVDGDAGLGGLGGQRPHQADHAVLGRDIGRDIGVALEPGRGRDEDDAAAFRVRHAGQRRLARSGTRPSG